MMNKQTISWLIVSALITLPTDIARAGNINVQTGSMRATVSQDRNINVKNGQTEVKISPNRSSTPIYRSKNWQFRNSQVRRNPWSVKPQVVRTQTNCKGGTYSQQSSQTTVSNGGVSRTYSSASTVCK